MCIEQQVVMLGRNRADYPIHLPISSRCIGRPTTGSHEEARGKLRPNIYHDGLPVIGAFNIEWNWWILRIFITSVTTLETYVREKPDGGSTIRFSKVATRGSGVCMLTSLL